jgi:signal transduction histidine kinase
VTLRRALGPLQGLARQARDVDPADPRLVEYGGPADEVGVLADGLARALDGIRAHRDAERERLADVAHELAAPLTVVTNHLRRLDAELSSEASDRNRERLQAALAAGDELLVSSQDLLTVLRGDLDERLEWHVVDLADVAAQVVSAYPGVHLNVQEGEATAILDPVRTRQIVRNLVRNAVRAAGRPDGVRVEVASEPDGRRVRVVVADDGPGLTPEEREAVFGRYVTGGGSTGLGLAVVQRLVAAQGGRVDATSEPGEGARFVVSFASAQTAWADDGADDPGDGIDADHADGSGSARTG